MTDRNYRIEANDCLAIVHLPGFDARGQLPALCFAQKVARGECEKQGGVNDVQRAAADRRLNYELLGVIIGVMCIPGIVVGVATGGFHNKNVRLSHV